MKMFSLAHACARMPQWWFDRLRPLMRIAFSIALRFVAIVLIIYGLIWVYPFLHRQFRDKMAAIAEVFRGDQFGETGLIYVESPEVYTRQRLVNDRYLHDAWLHKQLEAIDAPETKWLDAAQIEWDAIFFDVLAGEDADERRRGPRNGNKDEALATAVSAQIIEQLSDIPFETRFRLQAEARDKIRQLILENALDDRHDLSGNTVFGLKFDTSILPSSDTRMHPTVIVKMDKNPLERLLQPSGADLKSLRDAGRVPPAEKGTDGEDESDKPIIRRPEEFIGAFLNVNGVEVPMQTWELNVLDEVKSDFEEWIATQERRIRTRYTNSLQPANGVQSSDGVTAAPRGCPEPEEGHQVSYRDGNPTQVCLPQALKRAVEETHIEALTEDDLLTENVREWADALSLRTSVADQAVGWVMRQDDSPAIAGRLRRTFLDQATSSCRLLLKSGLKDPPSWVLPQQVTIADLTIGDLLRGTTGEISTQYRPVVGGWGRYVVARGLLRPALTQSDCLPDVHIEFDDLLVSLFLFQDLGNDSMRSTVRKLAPTLGLSGLACNGELAEEGGEKLCEGYTSWLVQRPGTSPDTNMNIIEALTPQVLSEISKTIGVVESGESEVPELCPVKLISTPSRTLLLEVFKDETKDAFTERVSSFGTTDGDCVRGRQVQLRLGAFEFFRRMAEVESYTYAAFPRGDVSGVVTEAGRRQGFSASAANQGITGWAAFDRSGREREFAAVPSVINFASGQSRYGSTSGDEPELFDFGWSVVKAGKKESMMVSQLVLVSVPAYLDKINLTLWKGFLDLDKVPLDRDEDLYRMEPNKAGKRIEEAFNDLELEERIDELLVGWEKRTIALNVPPDFTALDSIVIGRSEVFGPRIDKVYLKRAEFCLRPTEVAVPTKPEGQGKQFLLDVVIPGERLWRSTVVTLDGFKAERIEVMPDMRGILARFRLPFDPGDSRAGNEPSSLYVWTSEGGDSVPLKYCAQGAASSEHKPEEDKSDNETAEGSLVDAVDWPQTALEPEQELQD